MALEDNVLILVQVSHHVLLAQPEQRVAARRLERDDVTPGRPQRPRTTCVGDERILKFDFLPEMISFKVYFT